MQRRTQYKGVYPVLYAFWRADGSLDVDAMHAQVDTCIQEGAHGITVLGLVSEVHKQTTLERLELVRVVGAAIDGRVPYAVTIAEPSIPGQIQFAEDAKNAGADWVILMPPPVKGINEGHLKEFFGAIARAVPLPVALQNNPSNLDVWMSNDAILELVDTIENIVLMKAEGPAMGVAALLEKANGSFDSFSGHGGLEYLINLRSGAAGLIPAPELIDVQVRIFELFEEGSVASLSEAERLHKDVLPWIVFMSRSVPGLLRYGKELMAKRMDIDVGRHREPAAGRIALADKFTEETLAHLGQFKCRAK